MKSPLLSIRLALAAAAALAVSSLAYAQGAHPPSYTAAQAARGKAFYAANCALCHGDAVDDGQFAPPLKGEAHQAYWKGKTAADVLSYMNASMPPTQPGGLGAQAYADVYAFLLQSEGAAPGAKETPADPAELKGAAPTP